MKDEPAPDYEITITRSVKNPAYKPPRVQMGYQTDAQGPEYLQHTVTTATLSELQWQYVQRAILAVMGNTVTVQLEVKG